MAAGVIKTADLTGSLSLQDLLRGKSLEAQLEEQLAELEAEKLAALDKTTPAAVTDQVSFSQAAQAQQRGNNLMSGNFASFGNAEESRYIKAQHQGHVIRRTYENQMFSMVEALTPPGVDGKPQRYCDAVSPAQAEMAMKRERDKKVHEQSEDNLEEIRDNLEAATQEVMAPKDENGEPIPLPGEAPFTDSSPRADVTLGPIPSGQAGQVGQSAQAAEVALESLAQTAATPQISLDILV